MRVASLTPSNTEIVAFLGRGDDLVAVDQFSDWPPAVRALEDLGPDLQIDVDRLASLDPDLVLASESVPGMETVNEAVQAHGLRHLVLSPASLDGVLDDVREIGEALGVPERGHVLADAMASELDRLAGLTEGITPRRVYWEWWPTPPITPGGPGWMTEVLELGGGENVFADQPDQSVEVTLEDVAQRSPDVVAMCWQGTLQQAQSAARLRQRDGWDGLEAVQAGRILDLPEQLFGRPGPRLVEGTRRLTELLHPELNEQLGAPYAWVPDDVRASLPL